MRGTVYCRHGGTALHEHPALLSQSSQICESDSMRDRANSTASVFRLTLSLATVTALWAGPSWAAVTAIVGSARARVVQYGSGIPTQTDSNQAIVPTTIANPPAVARAQLETVLPDGAVTAGGSALAVFETPNLSGFGVPNDVGFDLGAFSDDETTTWLVEGGATERRTIRLDSAQAGTEIITSPTERARSRIVLSGVMLVTSLESTRDLTGVEVELDISVTKFDSSAAQPTEEVLSGHLTLGGGPDGAVTVTEATGAFETVAPTVADFSALVVNLPLVKAVLFAGVELPYEYNFRPNQPFDLELVVASRVRNIPGGTGGASVFGLPQGGLGEVLARVKQDDRGQQLAATVSEHVDTTGAAYGNGPGLPFLFPACGAMGLAPALLVLAATGLRRPRRRRCGARR